MKKKWIILVLVIVLLIAIRMALPYIIKNYVNKTIDGLESYSGQIADIDLYLFRGAYTIDSLEITKTGDSIPVPFIEISRIDLSVHWKALLKGEVVGEVLMEKPALNFAVAAKNGNAKQDGSEADWVQTLDELLPLQLNLFQINGGKITFKNFTTDSKVDLYVDSLYLTATNLSNVTDKQAKLPSTVKATGNSLGGGQLALDAKMNIMKDIPDMDVDFKFENVDLTAFNSFVQAYTKTDVEKGEFNLYTEIAVDSGQITGYVKPVIENLTIANWDKEDEGFSGKVWESVVGGITELFENQPKDQLATRVEINGNFNNPDVGVWNVIWNAFKNAFVEALSKRVDNSIDISALENKKQK